MPIADDHRSLDPDDTGEAMGRLIMEAFAAVHPDIAERYRVREFRELKG